MYSKLKTILAKAVLACVLIFFSQKAYNQSVEYIRAGDLEKIINSGEDKLFVINFWATWCGPCVKEFPLFVKVSEDYSKQKVKFIMVSLDFPSQADKQLIPFLKKNRSSLHVALMTDMDYNSWIDKVDRSWQGDLPATLIFNNPRNRRVFHNGELDERGLRKMIDSNL
jgi:thiol-disulfide isomerase/thioredoxin